MFTYAQVCCQERWRKELQVRKAFGDTNTVNVLSSCQKGRKVVYSRPLSSKRKGDGCKRAHQELTS